MTNAHYVLRNFRNILRTCIFKFFSAPEAPFTANAVKVRIFCRHNVHIRISDKHSFLSLDPKRAKNILYYLRRRLCRNTVLFALDQVKIFLTENILYNVVHKAVRLV